MHVAGWNARIVTIDGEDIDCRIDGSSGSEVYVTKYLPGEDEPTGNELRIDLDVIHEICFY